MIIKLLLIVGFLTSCSKKEVSWETQEDARRQIKENVEFVSRKFRQDQAPNTRMVVRGDSTIGKNCAQGDGWASVDFHYNDGAVLQAKCSTVSESIGCMTKEDFNKRDYSNEEGSCNNNIPFPIPKIKK